MEGYCRVTVLISCNPEMAMFRTFKMLRTLNILYLQVELTELEANYEQLNRQDRATSHQKRKCYHSNWSYLSRSKLDRNDERWQKSLEIRAKLQEYSKFSLSIQVIALLEAQLE